MTANAPRPAKGKRVETVRQARIWDSNKKHYLSLGLCRPCAAQAAWGHQVGFSQSKPPCRKCQPFVDSFPTKRANGWRSLSQRRGAKFSMQVRPRIGRERS